MRMPIPQVVVSLLLTVTTFLAFAQPIDQMPMYGGMNRSSEPVLRAGDDQFIAEVSQKFGSRENASKAWVDQGFRFYQRDDLANAMRRFNQAWLLNPSNPDVFWGFLSVLYDKGDNCGAMRMSERALALGQDRPDFLADSGLMYSLCSVDKAKPANLDKAVLTRKSDQMFAAAVRKESRNPYVFDKWWQALFWRGEYQEAWDKVFAMRAAGGQPHEPFLRALREKMPEPRQ